MEKLDLTLKETKDFFVRAFIEKDIIPILGAGFSCGMQARGTAKVPSGSKLKEDMINMILQERKEFTKEALQKQNFSWLAERFFKCDMEKISEYFYQYYTGIKFSGVNKKKFLNDIEWQYVYTLNVDTAIENSDDRWEVFYPNEEFVDKSVLNKKKLYKIHGDINLFCKTKDIDKLIFSETQYLKSLRTNSLFHDKLSADCIGHNLLYIGCSLDDEIDIKYSVITDSERNKDVTNARRIYVTFDDIESDPIKLENLEGFNITHYIKLENVSDYEMFYEFMCECYKESLQVENHPCDCYNVVKINELDKNRNKNLEYLLNIGNAPDLCKPYYYFEKKGFKIEDLKTDKINVFVGRRFSGKTLFAYGIIDKFKDRKKYFISSNQTISDNNIVELFKEERILIIMDANAISDVQLPLICNSFDATKENIVCIIVNTFDEIANNISYFIDNIKVSDLKFDGRISISEAQVINKKLSEIGIVIFDEKQTILDNTLRIGNELDQDALSEFTISSQKELEMLIWIAINKKIYLEQIMTLSLYNDFKKIVDKFTPILEIVSNKEKGRYEHSPLKVVCNAPIALIQILNNYAYPPRTKMGNVIKKEHFGNICAAIYHTLFVYNRVNPDEVKRFLLFDTLNDVFSRQYSKDNIAKIKKDTDGKPTVDTRTYGAAALIQAIYEDFNIQKLKAEEPNYWLQRAKSLYILNSGKNGKIERLREGIEWAKKAEYDSEILINKGQHKYNRTLSNATIQIAMLYGKLAYRTEYKDYSINTQAVHYYYKGLSDANNLTAANSLIAKSKGTIDFKNLLNHIRTNKTIIYDEAYDKASYLCNIPEYANGVVYRL